jgi:hypothetical protein
MRQFALNLCPLVIPSPQEEQGEPHRQLILGIFGLAGCQCMKQLVGIQQKLSGSLILEEWLTLQRVGAITSEARIARCTKTHYTLPAEARQLKLLLSIPSVGTF